MAKRRKGFGGCMPMPMKPADWVHMAAQGVASAALENDEHIRQLKSELADEVEKTVKRVMSGSRPMVKRRK